jgi:hypothetical protein
MDTPPLAARLIAAVAAVVVTLTLLHAVFAIAEPRRSVLIAKLEREQQPTATQVALATTTVTGARIAK